MLVVIMDDRAVQNKPTLILQHIARKIGNGCSIADPDFAGCRFLKQVQIFNKNSLKELECQYLV